MCDYCEKHHFLAVSDATNSRGVTTEIGISITGNTISTEEKRFVRSGSMIGYLSCNLCNYMMSYAWHYMQEQACRWEMRKGKDGVYRRTRVRLITHCDIYMDNFTIYGKNKRDLMRAERLLEAYMRKELGMHIKCSWRLYRLAYKDKHGKEHGAPVDAMGWWRSAIGGKCRCFPTQCNGLAGCGAALLSGTNSAAGRSADDSASRPNLPSGPVTASCPLIGQCRYCRACFSRPTCRA